MTNPKSPPPEIGRVKPLLVVALLLMSVSCDRNRVKIVPDDEIVREFRQLSERPLKPSPDARLLTYSIGQVGMPYGIEVRSILENTLVDAKYSTMPLVRATWHPSSRLLAYFRQDENAIRHLVFWNLENHIHEEIKTPITHNQYDAKWSPDGKYFAFTSDEKELIVVAADKKIRRIQGWFRAFSWSQDSRKIGLIVDSHGERTQIRIVDLARDEETLVHIRGWDIMSVNWEPYQNLLVGAQSSDKARSCLFTISPGSRVAVQELEVEGEISNPSYLPDRTGYMWMARAKGGTRQIVLSSSSGHVRFTSAFDGNASFLQYTPDAKGMFISIASPQQMGILQMDLHAPTTQPSAIATVPGLAEAKQKIIPFRASDGTEIKIDISEPPNHTGRFVIRMQGGSNPDFVSNWPERQLYLRHGVSYLSVSNRKPNGVEDLLSVCNFLQEEMHANPNRIAVLGESTAATIVLEAAMRSPDSIGTAVIIGLLNQPLRMPVRNLHRTRLFAFHGGADPFPAENARHLILNSVGESSIAPPNGVWHVFPGEAHWLSLSNGIVHATVLYELGVLNR